MAENSYSLPSHIYIYRVYFGSRFSLIHCSLKTTDAAFFLHFISVFSCLRTSDFISGENRIRAFPRVMFFVQPPVSVSTKLLVIIRYSGINCRLNERKKFLSLKLLLKMSVHSRLNERVKFLILKLLLKMFPVTFVYA